MRYDSRADKLVDLVLDYSVKLKKNDRLLLQFDPNYQAYADLFEKRATEIGAQVRYDSLTFDSIALRNFIKDPSKDAWAQELDRRIELSKWCNARVLMDCHKNENYGRGIKNSEERIMEFNLKVIGPYKEVLYRPGKNNGCEVKWNIVGFPGYENARKSGMSFKDFSDFVYNATIGNNWDVVSKNMDEVKKVFDKAKEVRIHVPGLTNLSFSLKGRKGHKCDGKVNMPDGEVFYGPVEDSLNGEIYFQIPSKREGYGIIEGIKLKFVNGKVVDFDAKKNKKGLEKILDTDEGASSVGEFGIGMNYGIYKSITDTLFDEKIGGTIHLALGDSFDELPLSNGGGLNKSMIHWDIICDLRKNLDNLKEFPGGQIFIDDNIKVQEDGRWLI